MSRIAGSNGARTAEAIRRASLKLIYDHGYEGFGLRKLAEKVGLQPASLYNHIASKQDLLFGIIADHMQALIRQTETVLADSGDDPLIRLTAFTANHLNYHIEKKYEVYAANFELRGLTQANLATVIGLRRHYENLLVAILNDGRSAGVIATADTHVAAYALLAMLTGACTWYKPEGRLTRAEMIELHVSLVLGGLVVPGRVEPASARTRLVLRRRNETAVAAGRLKTTRAPARAAPTRQGETPCRD